MGSIIEGIISLIVSYKADAFIQPIIEVMREQCISRGLPLEKYQETFNNLEMLTQICAFVLVFCGLELLKFGYHWFRGDYR